MTGVRVECRASETENRSEEEIRMNGRMDECATSDGTIPQTSNIRIAKYPHRDYDCNKKTFSTTLS